MFRTFLTNARIIDGTGRKAIENGLLIMRHVKKKYDNSIEHTGNGDQKDSIEYVGTMEDYDIESNIGEADTVMDLEGYTILPGLINTHVHLDLNMPYKAIKVDDYGPSYRSLVAYRRAAEALMCGVTTVRCVGMGDGTDYAVKKSIEKGMLLGSRVIAAGPMLIAHGGHGYNNVSSKECSGVSEFRKAARTELKNGADLIKIGLTGGLASPNEGIQDKQMSDDEITAVVEVAHGAGKKVAAHLGGDKAIQDAIRLGVDSVEHAYFMSEETSQVMAERGTFLVPTLSVSNAYEYLSAHGSPAYQLEKQVIAEKAHKKSISDAIKAGVKICCGTDLLPSDPIDGTNATIREVELLTESGMTPLQAIKAATYNSAELCDVLDKTGTLETGKEGDIIICKGSPDKNIKDLRNIELVAKGCRLVFSKIPAMIANRFHVLDNRTKVEGGTFMKW